MQNRQRVCVSVFRFIQVPSPPSGHVVIAQNTTRTTATAKWTGVASPTIRCWPWPTGVPATVPPLRPNRQTNLLSAAAKGRRRWTKSNSCRTTCAVRSSVRCARNCPVPFPRAATTGTGCATSARTP